MLAESLSGLGFYIEAVEQQRPERDRLIAPLIAKRLGEAPSGRAAGGFGRGGRRGAARGVAAARRGSPSRAERRRGARSSEAKARRACATMPSSSATPTSSTQADGVLAELEAGNAARLAAAVDAIADTVSARARDFRGDAAPAGDRREPARPRASRDLPVRGGRGAGRHRARSPDAARQSGRPRSADHGAPRLPHAEGQRPDGGPRPSSANTRTTRRRCSTA